MAAIMTTPQEKKVYTLDRRRTKGYRGSNYRAVMLEAERQRRRQKANQIYTYVSIAIASCALGVWLGIAFTNGI